MSSTFWNQRTFCVITGASRGIGKSIAIEFASKVGAGSTFVIMARSSLALEETKAEMLSNVPGLNVNVAVVDLGHPNPQEYLRIFEDARASADFELALLVHNAGSLGNISLKALQQDNVSEIKKFYEFNLYSMILLTSSFFKVFSDPSKQRSIVQISSDGAVEPFKTWSLYCAGKAARDMFIRSVAIEDPSIACLSYAPGLVDTDIYTKAEAQTGDTELAKVFQSAKESGQVIRPVQTVAKLIRILEDRQFVMGEHVAYRDVPDQP